MGRRELRTVANAIDWFAVVLGAERRAEEFQQLCLSGGGRGVRECVDFARARVRVRAGERACGRAACVCVRARCLRTALQVVGATGVFVGK